MMVSFISVYKSLNVWGGFILIVLWAMNVFIFCEMVVRLRFVWMKSHGMECFSSGVSIVYRYEIGMMSGTFLTVFMYVCMMSVCVEWESICSVHALMCLMTVAVSLMWSLSDLYMFDSCVLLSRLKKMFVVQVTGSVCG